MAAKRKQRWVPWNKGKIVGQKAPLKLREIWAIRVRLQLCSNLRHLRAFQPGDRFKAPRLRPAGPSRRRHENHINSRAVVMQRKTQRPVQFEITEMSRDALQSWTRAAGLQTRRALYVRMKVSRTSHGPIFAIGINLPFARAM